MNIHRGRYLKEHSSIRSFYSYLLFKFYKYVNIIFTKLEKKYNVFYCWNRKMWNKTFETNAD